MLFPVPCVCEARTQHQLKSSSSVTTWRRHKEEGGTPTGPTVVNQSYTHCPAGQKLGLLILILNLWLLTVTLSFLKCLILTTCDYLQILNESLISVATGYFSPVIEGRVLLPWCMRLRGRLHKFISKAVRSSFQLFSPLPDRRPEYVQRWVDEKWFIFHVSKKTDQQKLYLSEKLLFTGIKIARHTYEWEEVVTVLKPPWCNTYSHLYCVVCVAACKDCS